VGILADQRIQKGEKVLTAGGDQIFPRGLPVGVVENVVTDPERDSFIDVIVKPAAHLDQLDEVLVITSTEPRFSAAQQQDMATSVELKGAEVAAIKEQQKASQIMAERLPGLTDPNAPAPSPAAAAAPGPPGKEQAAPATPVAPPAPKLLHPLHPDRFTTGTNSKPPTEENSAPAGQQTKPAPKHEAKPESNPASTPNPPANPERKP
jgi:rod shape-determining protein MreC